MKKLDGRKLSHKTREEIRIRAVKQVEAGESPEKIIQGLGFHRSCIYEWLARYREGGEAAHRTKPLSGCPPKLTGSPMRKLYQIITEKNPLQLKFPFALWTCAMIREVIQKEFQVRWSAVSVGRLLKKLGMSPQRPWRRAYQQDPERVERWKAEEYPEIARRAKTEGAVIYFGEEASVRSDHHSGTPGGPMGQTPIVKATGARFSLNLISAITAKGEMRFMMIDGRLTADKFIDFLKRLIYNARHPMFLIVDGPPVHRSVKVSKFVESLQGKLRWFFLPPYSPELNPDELVWNHLKNHR
jgi:transposase